MMRKYNRVATSATCRVTCDTESSWQIRVEPGEILLDNGAMITVAEERLLSVRPGGRRAYRNQRYSIVGEARQSPCFWNGESIRGSGGMPYQRMVPGTLRVHDESRSVVYERDVDYCCDYYWGTIKRHPEGRIPENATLLLDYDVWLCRYDAVVLYEDGTIALVEGPEEAPESRELLLPDPPAIDQGILLANVFTGWGEESLYDGSITVSLVADEGTSPSSPLPTVSGRYLDSTPRSYWVEIVALSPDDGMIGICVAAEGIDYGLEQMLTEQSLRWSPPVTSSIAEAAPLAILSAYGHTIDWGLTVDFSGLTLDAESVGTRFRISARPHSVMPVSIANTEAGKMIAVENREALEPFRHKLLAGDPVRVAFYGESTTRSGHWPYQLVRYLRQSQPSAAIYSSNVAISGESSLHGVRRYEHEVRSVNPDLVILEYMLNDSGMNPQGVEAAIRDILSKLAEDGVPCLIVTTNGMNPVFGSSLRSVEATHRLYRRLAEEYQCAFVGGFPYFQRLHEAGIYFLTELKGNMVNHPYGNVDPDWGGFDATLGEAIIRAVAP